MASVLGVYDAFVFKTVDGQATCLPASVNLLELGAISFDRIVISGDVVLGNGKNAPLPNFANVEINGELDCSNFSITADSVLPNGITSLKCFYSINNLDVLSQILPSSVKKVYVRNAIINSIQKDKSCFESAQRFIAKFPDVDVIGKTGNVSLRDAIEKKLTGKVKIEKSKPIASTTSDEISKVQKSSSDKRSGYISISEAADKLKQVPDFSGVSVKDLKKRIKTFLYKDGENPLWGNVQNYVPENVIEELAKAILNFDFEEVSEDNKPLARPASNKAENAVAQETKNTSSQVPKPIVIKKFFDKRVWNSVCKAVKGNRALLSKFLNNINDVNLNPIQKDVRISADRVACVKDNELRLVPNLELKNGSYITQSFGRSNNRPRVVWCLLSNGILVAADFFANHGDGKNKCLYNSTISANVFRDKTEKDFAESSQDYLDVEDLLKDFLGKDSKIIDSEEKLEVPVITVDDAEKVVKEPVSTEVVPEMHDTDVAENSKIEQASVSTFVEENTPKKMDEVAKEQQAEVKIEKKRRARISRVIRAVPAMPEKKVEVKEIINKPARLEERSESKEGEIKAPSDATLYKISYNFEEAFNILNSSILEMKQKLIMEADTEKSLALTEELSKRLKDKQMIEQHLDVVKRAFDLLNLCINEKKAKQR